MKGKRGRPNIPLSNISNRKSTGLTSYSPAGEGDIQLARGGIAKKRIDKKPRKKAK